MTPTSSIPADHGPVLHPVLHRPATRHPVAPPADPAGARLVAGRYLLLDQIGAGGMGSVWRTRDLRTGELVATKVLGRYDGALLARFMREQAIRLRHPHVVAPTGWAAEDEVVLLVMDLVTGGSVHTLVSERGALPEPLVAAILEQTLRALVAVHGAGVVHRDVKPANLLLDPGRGAGGGGAGDRGLGDGGLCVRLADFGVAVDLAGERLTTSPAAVGTDGYMAPDQARGEAPDPRQDLYAVGVLGLHLLTGVRPSPGAALPSSPLRPLLERLLADRPDQRPGSADEALALLRRLGVPAYDGPSVSRDRLGPAPDEPTRRFPWRRGRERLRPRAGRPSRGTVLAALSLPVSWGLTLTAGSALARMLG